MCMSIGTANFRSCYPIGVDSLLPGLAYDLNLNGGLGWIEWRGDVRDDTNGCNGNKLHTCRVGSMQPTSSQTATLRVCLFETWGFM